MDKENNSFDENEIWEIDPYSSDFEEEYYEEEPQEEYYQEEQQNNNNKRRKKDKKDNKKTDQRNEVKNKNADTPDAKVNKTNKPTENMPKRDPQQKNMDLKKRAKSNNQNLGNQFKRNRNNNMFNPNKNPLKKNPMNPAKKATDAAKKTADAAKKTGDTAKKAAKTAKKAAQIPKKAAKTAKKAAKTAKNTAKAVKNTARAVRAAARLARIAARLAIKIARVIGKILERIVAKVVAFIVANPVSLIVIAVILVIILVIAIFTITMPIFFEEEMTNVGYYMPIGSEEETGDNIYGGEPVPYAITDYFGIREHHPVNGKPQVQHLGIDLDAIDRDEYNIIATKSGIVTFAKNDCVVGDKSCGGGFGNYVKIDHGDGVESLYAHNSEVVVSTGDQVAQGELIAISGTTGSSTGIHLHFEIHVNGIKVDPLEYVSVEEPRPVVLDQEYYESQGIPGYVDTSTFSITTPKLSESEFIDKINAYAARSGSANFKRYIQPYAKTIYISSKKYGVNPELVVTRADMEGYSPGGTTSNLWGYGCYNYNTSACYSFRNLDEGIQTFANNVKKYPNIPAMMSKYAYIGDYWLNPGSWSKGGCAYYETIKGYMTPERSAQVGQYCAPGKTCNMSSCASTIAADQVAYSTWQAQKMVKVRDNIFN